MSKTLVTYYSRTGNTRTIAEAIFEAIEGEKVLKPMNELAEHELAGYSLVFVGFPVQSHSVPYDAEDLLKSIPEGKKIALFSTHGSLSGHRLSQEALEYASVLTAKARVLGTFSCRGKVSSKALDALMKSPEHTAWSEMAASAANHPDESDLENARQFASWIQTRAAQD